MVFKLFIKAIQLKGNVMKFFLNQLKYFILFIFLCNFFIDKSVASSSFYGDSGFIVCPGSEIIKDRKIDFNLSYLNGKSSFVYVGTPNLIYSMSLGFIPRVEVGLVYNQIFTGRKDTDNPYLKASSFDRSIFFKFQVLEDLDYFPSLAIGGRDIVSNSSINNRGALITSNQQIFYLAAGKNIFDFKINVGYSYAPKIPFGFSHVSEAKVTNQLNKDYRINGFFGALETPKLFSLVSFLAEYDSNYFNYGIDIGPFYGISAKLVMVKLTDFNFGFKFENKL